MVMIRLSRNPTDMQRIHEIIPVRQLESEVGADPPPLFSILPSCPSISFVLTRNPLPFRTECLRFELDSLKIYESLVRILRHRTYAGIGFFAVFIVLRYSNPWGLNHWGPGFPEYQSPCCRRAAFEGYILRRHLEYYKVSISNA